MSQLHVLGGRRRYEDPTFVGKNSMEGQTTVHVGFYWLLLKCKDPNRRGSGQYDRPSSNPLFAILEE